ncbi:MAG: aminotransferase class IV [Trueperaceae bacterium]|nr:aminotransferase class IV [Trueperaceae bacterium]
MTARHGCQDPHELGTDPDAPPALIETLRYEEGYARLERHLARLRASAQTLGHRYAEPDVRRALAEAVPDAPGVWRVRLELRADGEVRCQTRRLEAGPPEPVPVALARERIAADDPWRRHKTTHRQVYDTATTVARRYGWADVLFMNQRGQVAEGAISNVFMTRGAHLITPPVSAGALPGVLRADLLVEGRAVAGEVTPADLRDGAALWIGNALRGLRRARLVATDVEVREQGNARER